MSCTEPAGILGQTAGNYRLVVQLFNKRFLSFLRKHDCHVPSQGFREVFVRRPVSQYQLSA